MGCRRPQTVQQANATPGSRSVDGPIETKFQQQDGRIKELEASVQQFVQAQTNLQKETKQGFLEMERRDQATKDMMSTSLTQFKSEMEQSVAHVLEKQAKTFNDNIADLKHLMQQSFKREREPEEDDMQTDRS